MAKEIRLPLCPSVVSFKPCTVNGTPRYARMQIIALGQKIGFTWFHLLQAGVVFSLPLSV